MNNLPELVFVFLGEKLPRYVLPSLQLASRYSGLSVTFALNAKAKVQNIPKGISTICIEDFYDGSHFQEASEKILFSHSYRAGFWLKTLERLFVVEQLGRLSRAPQLLHAELDQLIFRADILADKLRASPRQGVFLPFHDSNRALASILYSNSSEALAALVNSVTSGKPQANEMTLLADFAKEHPEIVHTLPTYASLNRAGGAAIREHPYMTLQETGGVVDAAQLGQWIGGIDPHNQSFMTALLNKHCDLDNPDLLSRTELEKLRFELDDRSGTLTIHGIEGASTVAFNLHLHSKIHPWLSSNPANLRKLLRMASGTDRSRVPSSREIQVRKISSWALEKADSAIRNPKKFLPDAKSSINRLIGRRPSSSPYLSGDSFRAFADFVFEQNHTGRGNTHSKPGGVWFCESHLYERFYEEVIPNLKERVVVILGNSDRNFGAELEALSNQPLVSQVFAQNLKERVGNVAALPIGLENAWRERHGRVSDFNRHRTDLVNRKLQIIWGFSVETNPLERIEAASALLSSSIARRLPPLSTKDHRKALSENAFIACPPGNGLDTHRTWEAMYLGCIPIVLRSYATESFRRVGLPILIVNSFAELETVDTEELAAIRAELLPKFTSEAMWSPYWFRQILETMDRPFQEKL